MQTGIENIFTLFALQLNSGEGEGGSPKGLSAQKNDSCDHFVLITQNKPWLLFIKGEQIHQCFLTKKVIAVRMVMTTMIPKMTSRMRFWMILALTFVTSLSESLSFSPSLHLFPEVFRVLAVSFLCRD
jgi:hypothetical protein